MLDKEMQSALCDQVNAELGSAYLYLGMSSWFMDKNLKGFAHWMRIQAKEELGHAMKIYDYILDCRGSVTLDAVAAPPAKWTSPLVVFEKTLAHEQKVTALINALVTMAKGKKDYATEIFLQWFVTEQIEEEAQAEEILLQLKAIGDHVGSLYMIDHRLSKRE